MRKISYAFISGLIVCFSACSPQVTTLPTKPLPTITPSPLPTATTIWFPSTPTFTRLPNSTIDPFSTPGFELEEGGLLLEDNFVGSDDWSTGKMEAGSIAYGKNELSLGILRQRDICSASEKTLLWMIFSLKSLSIQAYAEVRMNMESCFVSHPQWTSTGSGLIAPVKRAWIVSCLGLRHPHILQLPVVQSHLEHQAHRV